MRKLKAFPYHHVLVLGLARSGTAAAKTLLKNGKQVRVNDQQLTTKSTVVQDLIALGAEMVLGSHPLSVLEGIEVVVKNPGISYDNPVLVEAVKRNIPIVTEIEIAYQLVPGTLIGITGSNGKTTTTTLASKMLKESKQQVKVAGNIGIVATEVAESLSDDETLVLELSSFQLQGTIDFRPNIAVILNIYQAHLDYHKSLENYKQAKYNIFRNQTEDDYLIYNADDLDISSAVVGTKARRIPFSTAKEVQNGAWSDGEAIYFLNEKIIDVEKIVLVGEHHLENILAAICAAKLAGATNEGIERVLTTFVGVEHRLQYVTNLKGRYFYNDSKATNMLATEKALASFKQPTILLAGGLDRGDDLKGLIPHLKNVKGLVSFGETKEKFKEVAREAGISTVLTAENVEDAVQKGYGISEENDVILLSPACASWDQYRTFEERGDMFNQAVHKLL
ncbi:UDP-N-acetylmuramoyl-L-alanine--D-glutamate ligase [Oceanobacillus alkalisoli]|uniref:UDP-N-acetylmuramoyl-L-alanine--D-glutamate ligase n=1 Tax=Oceanobacillus alkalisoli TaxID=2925113 RepID=UPI001F11B89C|nr:UDP-N-acetylmuramoyl-L-alanine--D-glutamate ligase [Oceanobacillus alkalisoli]MCF3942518.1 UDP-N-acetylmuramoyl-L-alanine--D-glutamate ligase [Oceanobacillus alkalisoli]